MDILYHGRSPTPTEQRVLAAVRAQAEEGEAEAQYHLGVLWHRASMDPLRADDVESRIAAYVWFQLAALQGYKDSVAAWQRVALTMTRPEIAEGNRRVADFVTQFAAQMHCA